MTQLIRGGTLLADFREGTAPRRADVRVEGGTIVEIGEDLAISGSELIDATGGIVLPGSTDTHRHTWQAAVRGLCGDMNVLDYLKSIRWGVAAEFTPEDVYLGTLAGALEMVDAGVTQVVDFSHCINSPAHADAAYTALVESGMRAIFAYGFNAVPMAEPVFATHADREADFGRVFEKYAGGSDRVRVGIALSDYNQSGIDTLVNEIAIAREFGVPITFHPGALKPKTPYSTITQLDRRGLLGPDMILAHCTSASEEELVLLREAGAWVSSTPETEMQMGMGFPVIGKMLELGMRPTLGVDVVSDCGGDLFTQARLALQTERAIQQVPGMQSKLTLTVRDALRMSTEYGAAAADPSGRTGRIAIGLAADVVVLKSRLFELHPIISPEASAVLHSNPSTVDTVVIDGIVRKRGGTVIGHDLGRLQDALVETGDRVTRAWLERGGLDAEPTELERSTRERLNQ